MNCDDTESRLYTYLDGESTVVTRWKVRRHLRRCPPCGNGFTFEQRLKGRVREACREDPPRELEQRLRAFLRQHGNEGTEA